MIAFNFYEPLAKMLDSPGINWGFSDTLCLMLLFSITVRHLADDDRDARRRRRCDSRCRSITLGRLIFGLGGAVVTMAIVILAFHCAPVHKKIFNVVDYDSQTAVRTRAGPPDGWASSSTRPARCSRIIARMVSATRSASMADRTVSD